MAALPAIGEDGGWKQGGIDDISTILDCYCPSCGSSTAVTTMLPTQVPSFREIIIMSLVCEDCNFRNSEINFGGEIQPRGETLTFTLTSADDLNRQLIKSDSATITIPTCYDLEIPPSTQRGTISTIEGFFQKAAENLAKSQPERLRLGDVDNFYRCKQVIETLQFYATGEREDEDEDDEDEDGDDDDANNKNTARFPITIVLDDPAGNSFIENPFAPQQDPHLRSTKYYRTPTQDMSLGLQPAKDAVEDGTIDDTNPKHKSQINVAKPTTTNTTTTTTIDVDITAKKPLQPQQQQPEEQGRGQDENLAIGRQEVIKFATSCPSCYADCETDMCVTDIPHFKEVIIMSLMCEQCGYKSNEIKAGGAIPKKGNRLRLTIACSDDLQREILKSDTAGIAIPELDLELEEGGLDGLYTTVEGLIQKLHDRLTKANPFGVGDSATKQHLGPITEENEKHDGGQLPFSKPDSNHARYQEFLQKLVDITSGQRDLAQEPITLVITDPLANSFIGPIPRDAVALSYQAEKDGNKDCYDAYVDPRMTMEEIERTHDQNEILGLNDIQTENYQQNPGEEEHTNYGTDQMADVPDRIRRIDVRGPDHPHDVGKAPVENDTTVMGKHSTNFAVPSIGQRGTVAATNDNNSDDSNKNNKKLLGLELMDKDFIKSSAYNGPKTGMIYKKGAQGLGYYKDIPFDQI